MPHALPCPALLCRHHPLQAPRGLRVSGFFTSLGSGGTIDLLVAVCAAV
jgi:hypothetical protein